MKRRVNLTDPFRILEALRKEYGHIELIGTGDGKWQLRCWSGTFEVEAGTPQYAIEKAYLQMRQTRTIPMEEVP